MPDHVRSELIGADQGPQSDGFLPIWGWWLLALGIAVVSTAFLWFARIFYYYAEENPSAIQGRHKGDPPIPFQSTQDKVWLFAVGAAIGLFVLGAAYVIRARHRRSQDGWTWATKRSLAAAVFLLVGALASLATFFVAANLTPVGSDSVLEVGATPTSIVTATALPTTTTAPSLPASAPPTAATPSATTSTAAAVSPSAAGFEERVNAAVAVALIDAMRFDEGVTFCGHRVRGIENDEISVVAFVDGTCESYTVVEGIVELTRGQGIGARVDLEWHDGALAVVAVAFNSTHEEDTSSVFPDGMDPGPVTQRPYPDVPIVQAAAHFGAVEDLTLGDDASCQDLHEFGYAGYGHAVAYWLREGRPPRLDPDGNGRVCDDVWAAEKVAWFFESPLVEFDPGLACRDIAARRLGYDVAVSYWMKVGAPDRMDADRDGIPCGTVYAPAEIEAFVSAAAAYEPGLSCLAVASSGATWRESVAYWLIEGAPDRMVPDGDGIPCREQFPDWWATELAERARAAEVPFASGLLCRDLVGRVDYERAVKYWLQEGSPPRMDADGNGVPCETVYPEHLIADWLKFDRVYRVD